MPQESPGDPKRAQGTPEGTRRPLVWCFVECFVGCLVECFVGCLVECFVGCLVECFVRCLVECFVRCRPVGYRENVSMLHMSISLSGFVGPSCFIPSSSWLEHRAQVVFILSPRDMSERWGRARAECQWDCVQYRVVCNAELPTRVHCSMKSSI